MKNLGENLIFLISLPRSGSTLLQHIISSHSSVASTAEPWMLLPSIYALREGGLKTDYNANIGQIGLAEFLQQLPDGEERYYMAVRKMALELYNAFLLEHNKERFLDKTSRYYLILPELFRIFPKAKYIFLLRNPLAVLASFLDVMVRGNLTRLTADPGIRHDLLDGYRLIQEGINYLGEGATIIKYENLVLDPETTIKTLCQQLDLVYEPNMLNYGDLGVLPGTLVDPKSIHRHHKPVADYIDIWRSKFKSAQELHLARAFLAHLGRPLVESIGYPYDELLTVVSTRPKVWTPVVQWQTLMTPPMQRSKLQNILVLLTLLWRKQTLSRIARMLQTARQNLWRRARGNPLLRAVIHRIRNQISRFAPWYNQGVSTDYKVVKPTEISGEILRGWQDPLAASGQMAAYRPLLQNMYQGQVRRDFAVAVDCLRLINLDNPSLLEVGCGNGYYAEVLSYLYQRPFRYIGLDYSRAMIASAHQNYPQATLGVGDALKIPFADASFDIVWSGTVLMHLPDYKQAIEETCRVARRFCVFHSVPLCLTEETMFLTKKAYGVPVAEVIISQAEFEDILQAHGLVVKHILESLPYRVDNIVDRIETLTYICEKK